MLVLITVFTISGDNYHLYGFSVFKQSHYNTRVLLFWTRGKNYRANNFFKEIKF